jgi:hypothetical protein
MSSHFRLHEERTAIVRIIDLRGTYSFCPLRLSEHKDANLCLISAVLADGARASAVRSAGNSSQTWQQELFKAHRSAHL